jgi:hypothetical protein
MKKVIVILLILVSGFSLKAQRHHEIGLFLGVDYYMGDLSPSNFFGMPGYNFGLFYRYAANPRIAVRLAGHYGYLQGDSKLNSPNLQYKNLSFHSTLIDIEMGLEINFLEYVAGSSDHRFTPFIFGGISVFHFNPKTYYMGQEYELQPLGTEGQGLTAYPERKPYSLTSWSIPFGLGIKWSISPRVSIGLEWGLRKTFTDYLDDVSDRYPDPELLSAEKSPLAAALSNRQYEDEAMAVGLDLSMGPNGQPVTKSDYDTYLQDYLKKSENAQRGNANNMDWYSIAGLTIVFKIVGARQKSCPAYQKHSKFKEYLLF